MGDRIRDLVVLTLGILHPLIGTGAGFATPVDIPAASSPVSNIFTGDGDGVDDLVSQIIGDTHATSVIDINGDGLGDQIPPTFVRLQTSDGVFLDSFQTTVESLGSATPVMFDADRGGFVDRVMTTPGGLLIERGENDGTFTPRAALKSTSPLVPRRILRGTRPRR
jgi:hypothetical protein